MVHLPFFSWTECKECHFDPREMVVIENVVVALKIKYDLGKIMIWVSITNVSLVNFDISVKDWLSSSVSNQNLT